MGPLPGSEHPEAPLRVEDPRLRRVRLPEGWLLGQPRRDRPERLLSPDVAAVARRPDGAAEARPV